MYVINLFPGQSTEKTYGGRVDSSSYYPTDEIVTAELKKKKTTSSFLPPACVVSFIRTEAVRENRRSINRSIRELDREALSLNRLEQQLLTQIKNQAFVQPAVCQEKLMRRFPPLSLSPSSQGKSQRRVPVIRYAVPCTHILVHWHSWALSRPWV